MDLHPVDILIHTINIVVLFVILRLILWKPINRYLTARSARVAGELDGARKTKEEADALKAEYERSMDDAEERGREVVRKGQIRAAEDAQEIIKDARAQAEQLLADAHEKIANERAQAVVSARREIAQLATDMAARILKREVSSADNLSAIDDFFRETR